jgi:glycosyltransferase involved in cell wall biosynthesis
MTTGQNTNLRIAIVGTVGIPANYGGFETLVENLTAYADRQDLPCDIDVYCSAPAYPDRVASHNGARLLYLPIKANGIWSVPYDILALLLAVLRRSDAILVLGVSGAIFLPIIRLTSKAKLVVNIDGLEWKRAKWSRPASAFLRWCERVAVRFAHVVVADNQGIVDHVKASYGCDGVDIAYGGDHAINGTGDNITPVVVDDSALMLCRIEPENNVEMILEAFARVPDRRLVAVGNWNHSDFGRALKTRYTNIGNIVLHDPVYKTDSLYRLRAACALYIHGHSAGGTNPSLVEMMSLAKPVLAYDCVYNRYTTEDQARYFRNLEDLVTQLSEPVAQSDGTAMQMIAGRRYTWNTVGHSYFALMLG